MSVDMQALMKEVEVFLKARGWYLQQIQINQYGHYHNPGTYDLRIEAIGPFAAPAVRATPAAPTAKVCECGAAKTGGLHSSWCPLTAGTQP